MLKIKRINTKQLRKLLILPVVLLVISIIFYLYYINSDKVFYPSALEKNTPAAFVSEIYDKTKENYWNNISDEQLLELFRLSIEKNGPFKAPGKFENKNQLLNLLTKEIGKLSEEEKVKSLANIISSVLATLPPVGRSGLYGQKQELALKNTVENINPEKDLYKDLGIEKGASQEVVNKAFAEKSKTASKEELKQLTYAKDVLTKEDTKQRYDDKQVEPTIFSQVYTPGVLYVQFKKFSPTALDEFQKVFEDNNSNNNLTSLILDLRGNVGGAIDSTAYFLGFFLGKNQSAFEFYKKGQFLPFTTPTEKLTSLQKYKQVVILIDQNTQSSGEMLAASLKKNKIGVLLGTTTKGWGTVERVFPLENQITTSEKFSLFLVHSLTVRDDRQPIEGKGVEPDLNIGNTEWESKLFNQYRNSNLNYVIKTLL